MNTSLHSVEETGCIIPLHTFYDSINCPECCHTLLYVNGQTQIVQKIKKIFTAFSQKAVINN